MRCGFLSIREWRPEYPTFGLSEGFGIDQAASFDERPALISTGSVFRRSQAYIPRRTGIRQVGKLIGFLMQESEKTSADHCNGRNFERSRG